MNKKYFLLFCVILMVFISTAAAESNDNLTVDNIQLKDHHTDEINTAADVDKSIDNRIYTNQKTSKKEDSTKTITQKQVNEKNNTIINLDEGNYKVDPIIVDNNVTIIGNSTSNTFISTNSTDHLFNITKNSHLTLINLTINNHQSETIATINNQGKLTLIGVDIINNTCLNRTAKGGAIYTTGELQVEDSTFESNTASWGASVYNNGGVVNINNSLMRLDHTYNVGGSLYNIRGNMTVNNSRFIQNTAVSGAAIYNAFGKLDIENSMFLKNSAQTYYGGAIYTTGICNVLNSNFLYNNANYMGGAITNTNNFTAINSTFTSNTAGESGGAIENIPWTAKENGNIILIDCNFTENSAGINGGAIITLNSTDVDNNYGTITSRRCIYDSNSAGSCGGAIYSVGFIDLEYNVFLNDDAETSKEVYNGYKIKSVENNWWSLNNPDFKKMGVTPNSWVVMKFINTTPLIENLQSHIKVTLNTLNNGNEITQPLPVRDVIYPTCNATYNENFQSINSSVENIVVANDTTNMTVRVDNQRLTLNAIKSDITYKLINNNQTIEVTYNLPSNINAKTSIKVNSKTIIKNQKIVNGKLTAIYDIPTSWRYNSYTLNIIANNNGDILNKNLTVMIPKRDVSIKISIDNNKKPIKVGDTIKIVVSVKMANQNITTGKIVFKINGKTQQSDIRVVDGKAVINYTIPYTFNPGNYTISIKYSGDENKNANMQTQILQVAKDNIYLKDNSTLYLMSDSGIRVPIALVDSHSNYVGEVKLCYKINNITYKTNITLVDGVFYFDYITPVVAQSSSLKQTLTIKVGESKRYNEAILNIPLIIE